ncbi:MAG: glycerophosphodiester phosphodiesterase [Clostridia bacterium]|nr:glycerophosphodiester phosphodiesterase [Clostridia bacterium]
MLIFWIILSTVVGLFLILALLYLLLFIRPAGKKPQDEALLCDYAHRGLHDGNTAGLPENSLAAFELACREGYGIELDVQLSRDGEVMVFHDYTLIRMTGVDKKLCELSAEELRKLSLAGTDQTIPTFAEVLSLIDGRVPILVELKGENFDTSLCPKVAELLSAYKGSYCIESFNPLLIKDMKKYLPDSYRGLLYTNACRDKKKATVINVAVSLMLLNFLAKPNFIAFNRIDRSSLPVKLTTGLYRAPKFVWTVRSVQDLETAHKNGEHPIFENIPR